jgi:hypothetical protein
MVKILTHEPYTINFRIFVDINHQNNTSMAAPVRRILAHPYARPSFMKRLKKALIKWEEEEKREKTHKKAKSNTHSKIPTWSPIAHKKVKSNTHTKNVLSH